MADVPGNVPGRSGTAEPGSSTAAPTKKKKTHRGTKGKRKKDRRKSFAVQHDDITQDEPATTGPNPSGFYAQDRNLSGTSLDSEALLDHR